MSILFLNIVWHFAAYFAIASQSSFFTASAYCVIASLALLYAFETKAYTLFHAFYLHGLRESSWFRVLETKPKIYRNIEDYRVALPPSLWAAQLFMFSYFLFSTCISFTFTLAIPDVYQKLLHTLYFSVMSVVHIIYGLYIPHFLH